MAEYHVSKIEVLPGSDGYVAERLGGAGWSDMAVNIMSYVRRNQHSFVMATSDGDARFVVMRDAAGADCLVAVDGNGQLVQLSRLVAPAPAPAATQRPAWSLRSRLNRLLGTTARA
ncbi:hypothetical protein [Sandarakinorhabdus sp. AAP62]|uniref:hypothetical protein n=1 Tax=Sandarakinorhabdus sp. AAP62 TaxID=1248916 RepID=UPI00036A6578|nr:hypothetical protein [Sandarakinorhabdus sp. AAP62]